MSTISQIQLVSAICRHLDRQGVGMANARQLDAVVAAADLIVAAFAEPQKRAPAGMGLAAWLASDDTGLSSRVMARRLAPLAGLAVRIPQAARADSAAHPHDPGDFGRCLRLLEAVPELRPHLPAMAGVSPIWAALVGAWGELEALYREELPAGTAPRTYRRMRELIEAAPTP
jgi:hypothetical protein